MKRDQKAYLLCFVLCSVGLFAAFSGGVMSIGNMGASILLGAAVALLPYGLFRLVARSLQREPDASSSA